MNIDLIAESEPAFFLDVQRGLSGSVKKIPSKYFYDQRGSQLFDRICELNEYYLTRTEQAIMDRFSAEMAYQLGERVMLVEFGSGSSKKTEALLENLIDPAAYVPLDISEAHLKLTGEALHVAGRRFNAARSYNEQLAKPFYRTRIATCNIDARHGANSVTPGR